MKKNSATLILIGILLLLVGLYFAIGRGGTTLNETESAFAVKDTAGIRKIILTEYLRDAPGDQVILTREAGGWTVNKKYRALDLRVKQLLQTLYLVQVREPVNERARKNVFRSLKETHIRCEVELANGEEKLYFVGRSTTDGKGTMALLDRADDPYIIEIAGFEGYLTPRYSCRLDEWREKTLFDVRAENLKAVSVRYPGADSSFALQKEGDGWRLATGEPVDTANLNIYLKQFGKIQAQAFANERYPNGLDSLNKIPPPIVLTVQSDAGKSVELKLYPRTVDNYFGVMTGSFELAIVQRYVIDKFLIKRSLFVAKKS